MTPSWGESAAERLLDSRARDLARRRDAPAQEASTTRVLALALGSDLHAIPLAEAQRVTPFTGCTPVPGASAPVRGIIGLHGRIYTVLETATLLGRPQSAEAGAGHLVLLRHPQPRLALRCSRVLGALEVVPLGGGDDPGASRGPAAGHCRVPEDASYLGGTTLALIDPGRLLAAFQTFT